MRKITVTRARHCVLQQPSRRDINTLRKNPGVGAAAKELLRACHKVIKRIEDIPEHASRRKRATANNRVVRICQNAIERAES